MLHHTVLKKRKLHYKLATEKAVFRKSTEGIPGSWQKEALCERLHLEGTGFSEKNRHPGLAYIYKQTTLANYNT